MNLRLITQSEITERQQNLRTNYLNTQNGFSVTGIRRLMGSTFIAMGHKIHGRCEERRLSLANMTLFKTARGI